MFKKEQFVALAANALLAGIFGTRAIKDSDIDTAIKVAERVFEKSGLAEAELNFEKKNQEFFEGMLAKAGYSEEQSLTQDSE